jgi:DNA-binding CsgD family transcriptional regulator
VFEDVQWADQASVDLIRFLGRRAERLHAAIVATFRDDEIAPSAPLAVLLGDLATAPGVSHLSLAPLSREATEMLVSGSGADPEHVYRRTGGNPFFIKAVVAAGGVDVPQTVRDAMLARLARLRAETRAALEAAAIVGPRVDPAVLATVLDRTGTPRWTVQDAVLVGLMSWRGSSLMFRHELLQAAIAESVAAERRQHLHRLVFDVLGEHRDDPATLVRHADGAGYDSAVVELAPMAAERAAARGAHREAAAFYRKAIDRGMTAAPTVRADLLEREAVQRYLGNDLRAAVDAHRQAAAIRRSCGDRLGENRNLVRISALTFLLGEVPDVEKAPQTLGTELAGLPPSRELAMAYDNQSQLRMRALDSAAAQAWARKALAVAEDLGDPEAVLNAQISLAEAQLVGGDPEGAVGLRAAWDTARSMRLGDQAARAAYRLGLLSMLHRRYDEVERSLDQGAEYAARNGLVHWAELIASTQVRFLFEQGRWDDAEKRALEVLGGPAAVYLTRMQALVALGRLRARRGERDELDCLAEAEQMARQYPSCEAIVLGLPARAEAAWLAGDVEQVVSDTSTALAEGIGTRNPWWLGELAYWAHRAGGAAPTGGLVAEPYRLALDGDWAAAASWWQDRGCRYEAAIDLTAADDPDAVRAAVEILDGLGAKAGAARARQRLRELGVTSIPRGPRPSTQASKAGLTRRETEVLALVAEDLTNAEIARRLFLSGKTVERHMSSVLRKLNVRDRSAAVVEGRRAGALPPN